MSNCSTCSTMAVAWPHLRNLRTAVRRYCLLAEAAGKMKQCNPLNPGNLGIASVSSGDGFSGEVRHHPAVTRIMPIRTGELLPP